MTPEQFSKLPLYVREHILTLERQRDKSQKELTAYLDNQTESNIWFTDWDGNKVYISSEASERLTVKSKCGKIHLHIRNYNDDRIELGWSGGKDEYGVGDVALTPTSYQQARLVHQENMHVR